MKTAIKIIVALSVLASAMSAWVLMQPAPAQDDELSGHYHRTAPSQRQQHQLTFRMRPDGALAFRATLYYSDGDACNLAGIAQPVPGRQRYRYEELPQEAGQPCLLEFAVTDERITLTDPERRGQDCCGAKEEIEGLYFSRATKTPLK